MDNERPNLNNKIITEDFKNFYWLKSELLTFCREVGISTNGGKIEITNKISKYLETGEITKTKPVKKAKLPKATQPITKETIIGIEHRSYNEKKAFFHSIIGKQFHFTIHLLEYVKDNERKATYSDLINEWYKKQEQRKDPDFVKEIAPQFEYNIYIRDFMKDNPNKTRNDAIKHWKIKRSKPGNNKYSKSDLV